MSCWITAPAGDHWCGPDHQPSYVASTGAAIASFYDAVWGLDENHGWRFCGMTLNECHAACTELDCGEISVTNNGCCFPAQFRCVGDTRTGDTKYYPCESDGGSGSALDVANPSFEVDDGSAWSNLERAGDEVAAAPEGGFYALSRGDGAATVQETGVTLEAGKRYTLQVWARSVNEKGNQAATVADIAITADGSVAASAAVSVGVAALSGAPQQYPNDDGANVWIDGGQRVSFADFVFSQPLSSDPISGEWTKAQVDAPEAMALGQINLAESTGLRAVYGTWYNDGAAPESQIDLYRVQGTAPEYTFTEGPTVLSHSGDENPWVIDAHLYYDEDEGRLWMSWGGHVCYVSELDPATGKLLSNPSSTEFSTHAAGAHTPILSFASSSEFGAPSNVPGEFEGDGISSGYMEGPSLFKHGGYWWAFACYGNLGKDYTIRACRAMTPTGPYADKEGLSCLDYHPSRGRYGASMLLADEASQLVPGHPHVWQEGDAFYLGFDYRTSTTQSDHLSTDIMGIRRLHWGPDGWPSVWQPLSVELEADESTAGKQLGIRLHNAGAAGSVAGFDHVALTVSGDAAASPPSLAPSPSSGNPPPPPPSPRPAPPSPPPPSPGAPTSVVRASPGNACPDGYRAIATSEECRAGMEIVAESRDQDRDLDTEMFNEVEREEDWPRGCYQCDGTAGCYDGVWYNEHPTGNAHGSARPYCVAEQAGFRDGLPLFIGDSDIDLWASAATFPEAYNVGIGGYTCRDVKQEVGSMLSVFGPSWLVLVCGENDLSSASVAKTFSRFEDIVAAANAEGARVLYLGTKPEPSTSELHDEYQQYDALIKEHAAHLADGAASSPPPLVMVDVYAGFEALGNPNSLYAADRLHLSSEGYALWDEWTVAALDGGMCYLWRSGECIATSGPPADSPPPAVAGPPPPPSPPGSLPPRGVKVLEGNSPSTDAMACVTDPGQTTAGSGRYTVIAAQCCEADGTCRRFVGSNDDDGCVSGHSKQGGVVPTTFAEAVALCDSLGLRLCDASCKGKGCHYNRHPVWSGLECDAPSAAVSGYSLLAAPDQLVLEPSPAPEAEAEAEAEAPPSSEGLEGLVIGGTVAAGSLIALLALIRLAFVCRRRLQGSCAAVSCAKPPPAKCAVAADATPSKAAPAEAADV